MSDEPTTFDHADALCWSEDSDWEAIAERVGGMLVNREIGQSGEYETHLLIPLAPPPTLDREGADE